MRLIDADALKEKAFGKRGGLIHTEDIDAAPTIQPEEHTDKRTETHACDLISRQAAIDLWVWGDTDMAAHSRVVHVEDIEALPSAQPEVLACGEGELIAQPELIRCKDCKYYYYADNRIPQEQRYTCELNGDRWRLEDFCSYAERRADAEDGTTRYTDMCGYCYLAERRET